MAAMLSVPRIDGLDRSARWGVDRLGWDGVGGWDGILGWHGYGFAGGWDWEGRTGQGRAVRVRAVARVIDRPGGLRSVLVVLGGLGRSL